MPPCPLMPAPGVGPHAPRQRLASAGCRRQAVGSHRSARTGRVAGDGQPARLELLGGRLLGVAPTIISTLIPGIGTITAIGLAALRIIGAIGGALAGVAAGAALENALSHGIPKDELFVYKDALKHGWTVLIALTDDVEQVDAARQALALAGAESIDAARDRWWLGLRDAEAEAYTAQGGDFTRDESVYRRGFEAALHGEADGKPYKDVEGFLRARYPDVCDTNAFRHGYERGRAYSEGLQEKSRS